VKLRAALVCALFALASCADLPVQYAAVCRFAPGGDGLGGTGVGSDVLMRLVNADDRGIGGTGTWQNTDQRGLGGTGATARAEDRGLGGTGIVGVVTGFASICVNGYDVSVSDTTAVTVEGLPARPADIKLGQLVEIEAYVAEGRYAAASVNVRMAVAGPVTSVAPDKTSLVVAGQTVQVAGFGGSASAQNVSAGEWVAVSGLRRSDDIVVGTSIVPLPRAGREVMVAGPVRAGDDGIARIGALALQQATTLKTGETAVVRGAAPTLTRPNVMVARTVSIETAPLFAGRVDQMSVQAFATALDPAQVRVGTFTMARDVLTSALRSDLNAGIVQLEGRIGIGGAFTTERFLLPDKPADGRVIVLPARPDLVPIGPNGVGPGSPVNGGVRILPQRPDTGSGATPPGGPGEHPTVLTPPSFDRPQTQMGPSLERPSDRAPVDRDRGGL
jgi:hypothetical protein